MRNWVSLIIMIIVLLASFFGGWYVGIAGTTERYEGYLEEAEERTEVLASGIEEIGDKVRGITEGISELDGGLESVESAIARAIEYTDRITSGLEEIGRLVEVLESRIGAGNGGGLPTGGSEP